MPLPFAINTGSTISGTTQVGNIAVGTTEQRYDLGYGGLNWFMGPDDDNGYVAAYEGGGTVQFRASNGYADEAYVSFANSVSLERGGTGVTSSSEANIWFGENNIFIGTGYTARYQALYNSWTNKPNWVVSSAYNVLMSKLEGSNNLSVDYLSRFDAAWLFGVHTNTGGEALKNIINPGTNDATLVNSPYFNQFSGFKTDGVSSYVNLNWNPTDDGNNFIITGASFGVYGLDVVTAKVGGHGTATNPRTGMFRNYNGTNSYGFINQSVNSTIANNDDFLGLFAVVRTGTTHPDMFSMGDYLKGTNQASTGIGAATDLRIGQNSGNDTDERIGFVFAGGAFNGPELIELETILDWWFNFEWVSLGPEILINGDFSTGTLSGWTPVTVDEWIVTGNTVVVTGSTSNYLYQNVSSGTEVGKFYLVSADITVVTGSGFFGFFGTGGETYAAETSGTLRFIIKRVGNQNFGFNAISGFSGTLDNISLKEIIGLTS